MILLKNCRFVITQDEKRRIFKNANVIVDDKGRIISIGKEQDKSDYVIDCKNKVVLPSLKNMHTHLAMTLFRGYGEEMKLEEWLQTKIWPAEAKLNENYVYHGTLLACAELLKNGVTAALDMYFFGEAVKRAAEKAKFRVYFSQAILDFPTAEFKNSEQAFVRFKKLAKQSSEYFKVLLGTHAIYTCSKETLLKAAELSSKYNAKIHIHVSETRKEVYDAVKNLGKRPVEYLHSLNFLNENVICAHAVWLTKKEISLLSEAKASIAHCPVSNLKLASGGVAYIKGMLEARVNVCLGTDGAASNNSLDMFQEMKICALLQKNHLWDAQAIKAREALDMATINAFNFLKDEELGAIKIGRKCDLITLDLNSAPLRPVHDIVSNLVYSCSGSFVSDVIVSGEVVVKDRTLKTLDEEKVIEKAESKAYELINRL